MFNFKLYRWLTGIPRSSLLCVLFTLLMLFSQRSYAQTYANTQTNLVNGLCALCGVVNPNNAVNGNTTDYSSFVITAGLLGVSVEQTLIFPSATTSDGCDSLLIGIGSDNALIDLSIFQGVTVQTYNGAVPNPDATVLTSSILQVRVLDGANRIVVQLKPDDNFDRVKITLSSQLVGLLDGFRVYFAEVKSAGPAAPTVSPSDTTVCAGEAVTFNATAPVGSTFFWYTEPTGGSLIAIGDNFTTGVLSSDTTFYVESNDGTCASGTRTQLDVTVNPSPGAPTATPTDTTICAGENVTFNATAPVGSTFFWYTEPAGGSLIAIGDNFTTGVLSSDTTFYVESNDGTCASGTRTQLDVTVSPTPIAPTVTPTDTTVCAGQTVTFNASAPAGASFSWFTSASGGSPVATGSSFTTPALTSNTTYYAESSDGTCASGTRTQLDVTVLPTPIAPTVTPTDTTVCAGQTVTFNATAPAGSTFFWYTEPAGGSLIAIGDNYTTGALSADTIFYVESNDGTCASGTRTQLDVTVNPSPGAPTATPTDTTICAGETVTFNATAPIGSTFFWYTEPTDGSLIAIGDNYTTGALSADTTFYVESNDGTCASGTRTQLDVTVLPTPIAPTVSPMDTTICAGQTVTFNASAPAGASFNWYTEAIGGTPVATGSSFTTGTLTTDTTFYAESNDGACASGTRTQLDVNVLPTPTAPTVNPTDTTVCAGQTVTFNATAPAGSTFFWYTEPTGGSLIAIGDNYTTGALSADTIFYVESNDGTCASGTRTQLDVTVSPTPTAPTVTPTDTTVCAGQTVTFNASAPAGASFSWFTSASGGSPVATGSSFTTGTLNTDTTFYAESSDGVCASGTRTQLDVTVLPTPTAPTVTPTDTTVCAGQTVTFNASAPAGASFSWFTSASGGSPVATGSSFTTPALTSNTTYYAESNDGACASGTRTQLEVTVLPRPSAPIVIPTDTTICAGQTITFNASAPAGASFNWFTSASGGSPVATGSSFTTPALTSNTTYYAESNDGACASSTRTALTVTVNPTPVAPTVTPSSATICSGKTATFTSSVSGGSINWYTAPSGGSAVHAGNSFTTPALTSTTTYYAEAQLASCASITRTAVTVTVNPTPVAPIVAPAADTICSGQTTTLTVTSPPGTARWYLLPSGGSPLYTGTTFTTPVLTSNITFYADVIQGSCVSSRTPVSIQVRSVPAQPTVSPASATICSGQTATFNMTAPSGSVGWWYTTSSGGSPIFTGNTFTTPALTSTTTYYVAANNGACSSTNRRAVTVTVNATPAAPTVTPSSASICSGQTATFTASGTGTFSWYTAPSGGTAIFTGSTYTTPALTSNTTYYVSATSGSCSSATRTTVNVTITTAPSAPTVTPSSASICSGQTATFTASGTGTFNWYTVASGGAPIATGSAFTTPALTANTMYYVEAISGTCTSATRTAASVTITSAPSAPVVSPPAESICSGQTATFSATSSPGASINWYAVASGGTPVYTGSSFTTPALTSPVTYYAEATIGSCTSLVSRSPAVVTINAAPSAPVVTPSSKTICSGETASFTATADPGATINWYTSASGGTPVHTGSSFTSSALTSSTTYYAEAILGGCSSSSRTSASVTVQVCQNAVTSFTLVNATTDLDIATLNDGDTLDIATLPAGINIRANVYDPVTTKSVVFTFSAHPGGRTENGAPFSLFGDNNGNYNPWCCVNVGTYNLSATPYTGNNASGSVGVGQAIVFYIIDSRVPAILSYTLVNAHTNTDIGPLVNGQTLNLASLPSELTVRANANNATNSVYFDFSDNNYDRIENEVPFSLFSDINGDYTPWCCPAPGTYVLKTTPYSELNANGISGPTSEITFYIVSSLRISNIETYPNPTENNVVISLSGDRSATSEVIITDMSGKEYYSGTMSIESSKELNLNDYKMSSGVYILKVISGDQIETRKIIKK